MVSGTCVKYPLVSVVIPCRNRAHFLRPTIESVLAQDYPDIECIVVDAASTDGTVEILKSYGDRIRWVSEPDNGHADAINKGWKLSRGDILAWLNADDMWAVPSAVSTAVGYLREHPDVGVVYGDNDQVDAEGRWMRRFNVRDWDLEYAVMNCFYTITQPAAFMRRTILEKVGWLDTAFVSKKDHELWLRIGLAGKLAHIPNVLAVERMMPGYLADRGDVTAAACVELTRKFFTLPQVPEALRLRQRRAMSNACLVAAQYAWADGRLWGSILKYSGKAVLHDPSNVRAAWRQTKQFMIEDAGTRPGIKALLVLIVLLNIPRWCVAEAADVIGRACREIRFVVRLGSSK